jgi:hypothetical protein
MDCNMYSRKEIISLGIATGFCLAWVLMLFGGLVAVGDRSPHGLIAEFGQGPVILTCVSVVIMLAGLLAAYLHALVHAAVVSDERKRLWAVLLVVAHVFAMAAFWTIHMYLPWRRENAARVARRPLMVRARPLPAAPPPRAPRRGVITAPVDDGLAKAAAAARERA